jgi:hypothetical protein
MPTFGWQSLAVLHRASGRHRFITDCISPAYFLRQLQKVASEIPALRQISPIAVPSPACFSTQAI